MVFGHGHLPSDSVFRQSMSVLFWLFIHSIWSLIQNCRQYNKLWSFWPIGTPLYCSVILSAQFLIILHIHKFLPSPVHSANCAKVNLLNTIPSLFLANCYIICISILLNTTWLSAIAHSKWKIENIWSIDLRMITHSPLKIYAIFICFTCSTLFVTTCIIYGLSVGLLTL